MKIKLMIALVGIIAISGCVDSSAESRTAYLMGEVSDRTVSETSPGEIKLNAENSGNETSFYVTIEPVGDYKQVVEITDRTGESLNRVELGPAVQGATTGERFAHVRKKLNITSSVRVKAELHSESSTDTIDTEVYRLNVQEE